MFAGNANDTKTLGEIVEAMEAKYGRAQRIWVFDRGIVSEENLQYLRQRDGQYVVGTPKSMLRKFEQQLLETGWEEVEAGVEVKLCPSPEGEETFVLAKSRDRAAKEEAMHQRFVERIETGLTAIGKAAASGRIGVVSCDSRSSYLRRGAFTAGSVSRQMSNGKCRLIRFCCGKVRQRFSLL